MFSVGSSGIGAVLENILAALHTCTSNKNGVWLKVSRLGLFYFEPIW